LTDAGLEIEGRAQDMAWTAEKALHDPPNRLEELGRRGGRVSPGLPVAFMALVRVYIHRAPAITRGVGSGDHGGLGAGANLAAGWHTTAPLSQGAGASGRPITADHMAPASWQTYRLTLKRPDVPGTNTGTEHAI
jgi:hypothetical protein